MCRLGLGLGSGPRVVGRLGSRMRVSANFQIIFLPVGRLRLELGSEPHVMHGSIRVRTPSRGGEYFGGVDSGGVVSRGVISQIRSAVTRSPASFLCVLDSQYSVIDGLQMHISAPL